MAKTKMSYLIPILSYYLAWYSSVTLAGKQHPLFACLALIIFILIQIIYQYKVLKKFHGLVVIVMLLSLTGCMIDILLLKAGLIYFFANSFQTIIPVWMMLLWLEFSLLFYALSDVLLPHYLLVSVLAFILFPLTYSLGTYLGAATLAYGYTSSILLGIIWSMLLPMFLFIYNFFFSEKPYV